MGIFLEQAQVAAAGMGSLGLVLTLILCGLVALAVELFIFHGVPIFGIAGVTSLITGAVLAWVRFGPFWGGITVFLTAVVSITMTVLVLRSNFVKKRFVLSAHLSPGGGTASADLRGLVGKTGTARSDLRPAGIATVDNMRVDVVSEGGFIERESKIEVVRVDGPRVIVTRVD